MIPTNVIKVPTTIDNFYSYWLHFYQPIHRLTRKELDLAVMIMRRWYKLLEEIKVESVAKNELISRQAKAQFMVDLGVTTNNLEVLLTKLRKSGYLNSDNSINERYLPCFDKNGKVSLAVLYDIKR